MILYEFDEMIQIQELNPFKKTKRNYIIDIQGNK
jgi:hypothetical protein